MSNEIITYDLSAPQKNIELANMLKLFISQNGLSTKIQDRQYVNVEGWAFAGSQLGLYPILIESKNESTYEPRHFQWKDRKNNPREKKTQHFKYRATMEIRRLSDDKVVSRSSMLCTNDEFGKYEFAEYAVESMAQTRAEGKAYRLLLSWIIKAAGFEQTPAEEIDDEKREFFENCPTVEEKKLLNDLVYSSTLSEEKRQEAFATISGCTSYELFHKIEIRLKDLQPSIDQIVNPSQSDINRHIKKAMAS